MEISHTNRNAGLGILLTWCGYIAFVFLTDLGDYALNPPHPEAYMRWMLLRLATTSVWLLLAVFLLWYRRNPASWRSFLSAFLATGIPAAFVLGPLISQGDKYFFAIAASIGFYAILSGLVCMSIRRPRVAALSGVGLFAAQLLIDATVQLLSGAFRFQ